MPNIIQDTVHRLWTTGRKTKSSNGWIVGDCPCCQHNGESPDKRQRGHLKINGDGSLSYGCFNCRFKANYTPGYQLSYSFRKLLEWCGATESEVHLLVFEALREKEQLELLGIVKAPEEKEEIKTSFKPKALPPEAQSIMGTIAFHELKDCSNYHHDMINVIEYAYSRKLDIQKYDLYWTPNTQYKMNKRLIVPFRWKNETIGYTARAIDGTMQPRYLTEVDSGYVFNLDLQSDAGRQFVLVMEGPMDAMVVDGTAVLHGEINKQQISLLESLNKEIIVVPDFEKSGSDLVKVARDQGWSVSFPIWAEKCKDTNQAVTKYGRLFVLKDILENVERQKLKIDLMWRKYAKK